MADTLRLGPATERQPRLLEGFGARMIVHAPRARVDLVAQVCARTSLGAVYVTPIGHKAAARFDGATHAVRAHTAKTHAAPDAVLLDAQRYSGKARSRGVEPHDLTWTEHQHQLGLLWALTDSGYIGEVDRVALEATLAEGARHRGATVVALPLHASWLTRHADEVRDRIDRAGLPVALMLEHTDDPFELKGAVPGLLEVLRCRVPVSLLRCDVSAVGALAHGAAVGGVGTATSLRHIFPVRERSGGGANRGKPAAVVPRALVYKQLDRIREATRVLDDETVWSCDCLFCGNQSISWIIDADDAFTHSLATLAALTDYVLSSPDPVGTWRSKCHVAQCILLDIESRGLDWKVPRFFGRWLSA